MSVEKSLVEKPSLNAKTFFNLFFKEHDFTHTAKTECPLTRVRRQVLEVVLQQELVLRQPLHRLQHEVLHLEPPAPAAVLLLKLLHQAGELAVLVQALKVHGRDVVEVLWESDHVSLRSS